MSRRNCPMCADSYSGVCDGECYRLKYPDYVPTQEDPPTMPEDQNPKAARAIADGKLRLELIETALTHPLARVMAHGADKYGVRNWRTQPIFLRTYVAAMRRHVDAIADGQWLDPDSGEPHAAHVAACAQVVLDARAHSTLNDDTDYAEGGVPGGVAANVAGGAKPPERGGMFGECPAQPRTACCCAPGHCIAEYANDAMGPAPTDDEPVGAGVAKPEPLCPLNRLACPVRGGCTTPCKAAR